MKKSFNEEEIVKNSLIDDLLAFGLKDEELKSLSIRELRHKLAMKELTS